MTVQEVIDRVNRVKPNGFSNADKIGWLNEVEGKVQTEIFLMHPDKLTKLKGVSDELMVPFPYDSLYDFFLQAMIDFHNNEYDKYANTYEMFNVKWKEYEMWRSTHYPTVGKVTFGEMKVGE